ncbi:DUF1186 domain-containing protein [Sedimentitalea todarodis]|uniref:DUF1186 domain-containing protein n=1 Tax=Sedimentitalea todarodis TaxID=1631240 RepID=UPI00292D543D|nr:DUF1186 domain-containing protein [Sedimentitalea todarodis]
MRDLARDDIFPKAAMAEAGTRRDEMMPVFVDLVSGLARQRIPEMKDTDVMAFIPVFHLLGEWQDPRAYRPLVELLRRPTKVIDHLLGDAVTESSFRVIAGTFDGDLRPIFDAIEDKRADEFARSSLMSALVLIAQLHTAHRPAIEDYFRTFRQRCPRASSDVLTSWMDAVAALGLEDMSETVREVFDKGLIPKDYCDFGHFLEDLGATLTADGSPANRRYQKSLITDAIDDLSKWHCYSDAFLAQQKTRKVENALRVAPWTEALTKTPDKLGRNDPCPCGSGKKFKKCCLH